MAAAPSQASATSPDLLAHALAALAAGLCVLPPREDGSKRPDAASWTRYQRERPPRAVVARLYADGRRAGLGFVCGPVSGDLECLEFDDPGTHDAFVDAARAAGLGDLVERVAAGYEEATPGGGAHWLYRCPEVAGNTALARRPRRPEEVRHDGDRWKVLVETRGAGGYVVAAPSRGGVHPSGKPYVLRRGGVGTIAPITPEERADLWALARTFDQGEPQEAAAPVGGVGGDLRPGDDYDARADWQDILEPHGWAFLFERGGVRYLRRPGKDAGVSATVNWDGRDKLRVFTTSTGFEPAMYSKFGAHAVLEHGGDFAAAARALRAAGYGGDRAPVGPASEDSADSADAPPPWEPPVPLPEGERPPFPTETLPEVLRRFVAALATATQTPPALAALVVLAAVAAAAAKRVAVVVRDGWREPVNLYALVALGSGNRKSAVVQAASAPLRGHERAEAARLAAETARAETRRAIAEKALDKARSKAAGAEGDEFWRQREEAERLATDLVANPDLRVPRPPRLLVDDVTPEKLAAMMADNEGRMAVLSAEGGLFDVMAGRFSRDGKSPNLDLFLKAHAGDDLPVDRLGRPSSPLTAPALTLGLAVQPHVVAGLVTRPQFRGTGLLARFAYAMPESFVGRRRVAPDPVPPEVADAYAAAVGAVLSLTPLTEADGSPRPRELALSQAAAERFRRFERALEPRLGPAGELGHVADWGAKLAGLVARIAGLFHAVEHATASRTPWEHDIALSTMEAAIALAEGFLVPHALTAFGEMGADPALEEARVVLGAIERWDGPVFSRRDLHQRSLKRRFDRPDALDRPLAILAAHGYLRPVASPGREGPGRRPSDRYEVNPLGRPRNPRNPHNAPDTGDSADSADCEDGGWGGRADPGREAAS